MKYPRSKTSIVFGFLMTALFWAMPSTEAQTGGRWQESTSGISCEFLKTIENPNENYLCADWLTDEGVMVTCCISEREFSDPNSDPSVCRAAVSTPSTDERPNL